MQLKVIYDKSIRKKARHFYGLTIAIAVVYLHCKLRQQAIQLYLSIRFAFRQTCEENRSNLTTSLKCVALCCQVCSLFCTVARFFQENTSKLSKLSGDGYSSDASHEVETGSSENLSSLTSDVAEFPRNLFTEWQEFFSGTLFSTVLELFLFHAGKSRAAEKPAVHARPHQNIF